MRLTREENPESLRRYQHIKPARAGVSRQCLQLCPGTTRTCSREKGHAGPHVAFGLFRRVSAVWDGGEAGAGSRPPGRVRSPKRTPIGLRSGRPAGPLDGIKTFLLSAFSSFEELAWAVFFVAFVLFAVGGFLLIYLG